MFSFSLPLLGRPLLWYGFFFALGFLLASICFTRSLKKSLSSIDPGKLKSLVEKLYFYALVGIIIGARLFDVLFYQNWTENGASFFSVLRFWEPGLASHGGVIGLMVALFFFQRQTVKKFPALSWKLLLDLIAIPALIAAACIRIGNFMNQEILGIPAQVPWAIIFAHPIDGSAVVPRHPVQLYESLFYLIAFFGFWIARSRSSFLQKEGNMAALVLIAVFTFRFFIEFLKSHQSAWLSPLAFLDMGQILSLPCIAYGIAILCLNKQKFFNFFGIKRN